MFGLGRRRSGDGRLGRLLADYPSWAPPHLGHVIRTPGSAAPLLTLAQVRENFEAYRAAVPARIAALRPVLAALDCPVDTAYADAAGFVRRLHPMLLAELPTLYRADLATRPAWETSDRAGEAIVLSFLADLAMLTGDVLIAAKPGAFWGLDLDPRDRTKFAAKRPCLLGLVDRLYPDAAPDVFPLEAEWFGYYANMDDPARLAPPGPPPGQWSDVIGGILPERLERYMTHPDLATFRRDGWMADAA
jgi:hypothetical protein